MKKVLILFVLLCSSSTITIAQHNPAEVTFERNRARYTREHFSEGEDASSGFDYVYFRSGKDFVMIRSIWSATHSRELRIEDMYFADGGLALFKRSTARKNSLTALISGRRTGLFVKEEMSFENGRLTRWIENGAAVSESAASWPDAEKLTQNTAKGWIESYADLKNANK